jgi:hypothetical protein
MMTPTLALVLAASFARAATLPPPPMADSEGGQFETLARDGKPLWTAEWHVRKTTIDGRPAINFTEEGRGQRGEFKGDVKWKIDGYWWLGDALSPGRLERVVTGADGKVLEKTRKIFDQKSGKARFEREGPDGVVKTKELDAPEDTIATEGIATALRSLPFGTPLEAHLMTGEPHVYKITLKPEGREKITTPAGTFDCFKVRLIPELGVLSFVNAFVPDSTFWFQADPPHLWVRYEGLESGLTSPRVEMSLKGFGPEPPR